jgi:hypothetical protein
MHFIKNPFLSAKMQAYQYDLPYCFDFSSADSFSCFAITASKLCTVR